MTFLYIVFTFCGVVSIALPLTLKLVNIPQLKEEVKPWYQVLKPNQPL